MAKKTLLLGADKYLYVRSGKGFEIEGVSSVKFPVLTGFYQFLSENIQKELSNSYVNIIYEDDDINFEAFTSSVFISEVSSSVVVAVENLVPYIQDIKKNTEKHDYGVQIFMVKANRLCPSFNYVIPPQSDISGIIDLVSGGLVQDKARELGLDDWCRKVLADVNGFEFSHLQYSSTTVNNDMYFSIYGLDEKYSLSINYNLLFDSGANVDKLVSFNMNGASFYNIGVHVPTSVVVPGKCTVYIKQIQIRPYV